MTIYYATELLFFTKILFYQQNKLNLNGLGFLFVFLEFTSNI